MKRFLLILGSIALHASGYGQILPSAQRQQVIEKQNNANTHVQKKAAEKKDDTPEKISCAQPTFAKKAMSIFNEYRDSVTVNIFWKRKPNKAEKVTIKGGRIVKLSHNEKCKILIIYHDQKHFCTGELQPNINYEVVWDPASGCFCLAPY